VEFFNAVVGTVRAMRAPRAAHVAVRVAAPGPRELAVLRELAPAAARMTGAAPGDFTAGLDPVEATGGHYEPIAGGRGGGGVAITVTLRDAAAGTGAADAAGSSAEDGGAAAPASVDDMERSLEEREARLTSMRRIAEDPKFQARAPAAVRAKQEAKIAELDEQVQRLRTALEAIK
jgi:hypothetical protein